MKRWLSVLIDDSGGSLDKQLMIFGPDGSAVADQSGFDWGKMFEDALIEAGITTEGDN